MSSAHHREQIVLYALLTSLTAFSIDALLPALRLIDDTLPASTALSSKHVISLFIFGMAFGELLLGPLSDAIGRKKALLLGLGVYVIGTIVALQATSIEGLVFGRILQGVGVSGPKIATRAIIRDQFEGDAMARIMSFMFALFILVPMIAPALGQGVIAVAGWRGVFAAYLAMAALLAIWFIKRQPETLPPDRRIAFQPRLLIQNGARVVVSRRVSLMIAATGLVFGAQLLYLSTAADLFFDVYGIVETLPVYFAVLAAGIGLAALLNARFVQRFGMRAMTRWAFCALTLIGLLMIGAALHWAGRPPLSVFMILAFSVFFAMGILFGNLNALAMRSLGRVAGLGASLIASGSSMIATAFAVALGALYDGTTLNLAIGVFLAGIGSLLLSELSDSGDISQVDPVT